MKKILYLIVYILLVIAIIPAVVTHLFQSSNRPPKTGSSEQLTGVLELEEYIVSVVAAEMPASFEPEALKAQAVAARTYAVYNGFFDEAVSVSSIGQAYVLESERKTRWGTKFNEYESKIRQAVTETSGEILVYDNEAINAVFHALSAGMTESAVNAWNTDLPYLQSVDSRQDEEINGFLTEKEILLTEFLSLCEEYNDLFIFEPKTISIKERSQAGYVLCIQIGNMDFTGSDLRVMLELRSSCFNIAYENTTGLLTFSVKGYGHGAGMSQYGANSMAKEGSSYKSILEHYYQNTELSFINSFIKK